MSLVNESGGGGLDGLSQLRALMASGRKPGILVALDFEFVEVEAGKAVFAGTPGEHAYNPIGTVHGGYAAGHLRLSNLCWIYDNNHITIEGNTSLAFSEDVAGGFFSFWGGDNKKGGIFRWWRLRRGRGRGEFMVGTVFSRAVGSVKG